MKKNKKYTAMQNIISLLRSEYPDARCALEYSTPFQLLIATILSAQCTDERVNKVTPLLFARFPDPASMANAEDAELEQIIHSTGFYRAKAKNIKACAQKICEVYQGNIPSTMDELHALPGVGRKTANVVLGNAFGINHGITVDTHVLRLMRLLGFTKSENAEIVERELMPLMPEQDRTMFTHLIISHGRAVCIARRPKCTACVLAQLCPSAKIELV
jgi:endonuclease-3